MQTNLPSESITLSGTGKVYFYVAVHQRLSSRVAGSDFPTSCVLLDKNYKSLRFLGGRGGGGRGDDPIALIAIKIYRNINEEEAIIQMCS